MMKLSRLCFSIDLLLEFLAERLKLFANLLQLLEDFVVNRVSERHLPSHRFSDPVRPGHDVALGNPLSEIAILFSQFLVCLGKRLRHFLVILFGGSRTTLRFHFRVYVT